MNQLDEERKDGELLRSWEDKASSQEDHLAQWQKSAFRAALEKLQAEHGTPDTVMRMGEAFGRGLHAQRFKEKSSEWTLKEWVQEIQEGISAPLGTEFTFTKVSNDVVATFMNRNPLACSSEERTAKALFNFGVMRGLLRSAFPDGELVVDSMKNDRHLEFIFKAHASAKDKLECGRAIHAFHFLKKEDGV